MWFRQLTYADQLANNAAMIDHFPQRMDRFLDCISQVYFQQDSFDAIVFGKDKAACKAQMRNNEAEMQKEQASAALPTNEVPGADNWDYQPTSICECMHAITICTPHSLFCTVVVNCVADDIDITALLRLAR